MTVTLTKTKNFWQALTCRATGAAVVTSAHKGVSAGFLALSVTHLTANPPTVMLSIGLATSALPVVMGAGVLAINYLAHEDKQLARVFSGETALKGQDRFDPALWEFMHTGAPVLKGALGVLDCQVQEMIERHDVFIVLASVVAFRIRESGSPLLHFRGKFN